MTEYVNRRLYEKPPVVERAVSILASIDPETYEKQLSSWQAFMKPEFPEYEPVTQWLLNVKQQPDGAPIFDPSNAEITVHHRFWRRHPSGNRSWCVQLRPDRLTINLLREGDDRHKFEEMSEVLTTWLPKWAETFGVEKLHGTQIEYVNVISARVTPQFIDQKGGIKISDVFLLFSSVPMKHEGLAPPYDSQLTIICDKAMPCYLTVHVFGSEYAGQPAIQIRFKTRTDTARKMLTLQELNTEIAFSHGQIIEAFEKLFTSPAKKSFLPQ